MAVSFKRSCDGSIPNMARTKRSKPEEQFRRYSKEDEMIRRLYMDLLERQSTLQPAATQQVDIPPSYPMQLENGHASNGWHTMQEPQNQRWDADQTFVPQSYIATPPRIRYDPQTSAGIVPSSLSTAYPVAPYGSSDFHFDNVTIGLPDPAIEASQASEASEPFNIALMNNLDSDSLSRHSSRYLEDQQSTSDSGSDQNDTGRQHVQYRERPTAQEREKTKNTRKHIACVRCSRQRIRCISNDENPFGPCGTCKSIVNQSIYRVPCLRLKVGDIVFFREGNSPSLAWSRRWNNTTMTNVTEWESSEIKFIQVSHGYCSDPLKLEVRRFVPREGDVLHRKWVHGQVQKTKSVEPYAIENMKNAAKEVKRYISANVLPCLTEFLDIRDKIVRDTYMLAYKQSTPPRDEGGVLLSNVLYLWFAVRHTTASEYLCGPETLGMTPEQEDQSYPLIGKIPIAPVMSAQLELILTLEILRPLRKRVLDQLQKMIKANEPKYWFPIYLSCFILLHSCSLAMAWQYHYSRRNGVEDRYSMPTYIKELHKGANTLLAHFHYCNQGSYPFSLRRNFPASMAELNEKQVVFIIQSAEYFEARKEASRKAKERGDFHEEMYFVSQLFEDGWEPGPSV